MEETRATARLPHLDVEIAHRRLPDEGAEQLSIHLRARPDFGAFAEYLESRPALWSSLALSPFMIWQQAVRAFWAPWLPAPRALPRPELQPEPERHPELESHSAPESQPANVHRFPGPDGRNG